MEDFLSLMPKEARENIIQPAKLSEFKVDPSKHDEIEFWLGKITRRLEFTPAHSDCREQAYSMVAASAKLNGRRTILLEDCKIVYCQLVNVHKDCGSELHFLYELYYFTDGKEDPALTQEKLRTRLSNHPTLARFLDKETLQRVRKDIETAWSLEGAQRTAS